MISLRRRLVLSIFSILLAGTVAVAILTFLDTRNELTDLLDENMQQVAIAVAMQDSDYQAASPRESQALGEQGDFLIQVWANDGTLRYASHPTVKIPLQAGGGFGIAEFNGQKWRYYTLDAPDKKIQIVQPMNERQEDTLEFTFVILIPLAGQLPVVLVLAWLLIGRGLKPLQALSESIEQRDSGNLSPVGLTNVPFEIRTLVEALNSLLLRLNEALARQRRFIADAAHELRTPLTAISLQLDVLERAENEADIQEGHEKLRAGIERGAHLVANLLLLARQDPDAQEAEMTKVDLTILTREIHGDFTAHAAKKNLSFVLNEENEKILLLGDWHGLRAMIGNVVQNAILYTPSHGRVDVILHRQGSKAVLSVADSGIGIPAADRERVFDRFYRGLGTGKSGSGLGLSITKEVAERHRVEIVVQDGPGGKGTEFRMVFDLLSP